MPYINVGKENSGDIQIYYKDWGSGPVVTFSHGWPLNSDAWDGQMLFLVQHGYRCVALDRRGHGRSSQASAHNDMDGYADDLAAVIEALDRSAPQLGTTIARTSRTGTAIRRLEIRVPRPEGDMYLAVRTTLLERPDSPWSTAVIQDVTEHRQIDDLIRRAE